MKQKVFCAFCSLPQKIYTKKHVHFFELILFAGVGAILTHLIWQDFHIVGPIVFCVLAMSAETVHRLRWRASVKCKHCGFDPLLYKQSPEEAAQTVKAFLDRRKEDPLYLLKPQPQIKPIIKKVKDYKPSSVSKDIQL